MKVGFLHFEVGFLDYESSSLWASIPFRVSMLVLASLIVIIAMAIPAACEVRRQDDEAPCCRTHLVVLGGLARAMQDDSAEQHDGRQHDRGRVGSKAVGRLLPRPGVHA